MRYNLLGQGDHWFPGERAGDMDESKVFAAVKASPFAERIPGILKEAHALLLDETQNRLSDSK